MMTRESSSPTSLAPGFRFHPTDEELVRYYLKRKVTNKPTRLDPIASVDIYKSEPWDLPSYSKLKTRDLEWYFFSALDKKYGNGSKTNRATEKGYWKTTGNDRPVTYGSRVVGMKKTLVYHLGRAPRGKRSNWVMHEYRLVDVNLEKAGGFQDGYVLCRIFQKSGTGPKNGEKYGAPFIEEEWEDEDELMGLVRTGEGRVAGIVEAEVVLGDDVFYAEDPGKNVDDGIPPNDIPPPLSFYYGDSSNSSEQPVKYSEAEEEPVISMECGSEMPDDNLFFDIPEEYERGLDEEVAVKNEFVSELSDNVNPVYFSYPLDDDCVEAVDNNEGLYLKTNDLSHSIEADYNDFDVGEYLMFFDADGETPECTNSKIISGECSIPEQAPPMEKPVKDESEQISITSQNVPEAHGDNEASSSMPEPAKFESDFKYPFMKQAGHFLENIPAPPAFASEFPSKYTICKLNSEGQSSSSVHVNAGMIRIRNVTLNATGMHWSYDKNGNLNVVFSFDLSENAAPSSMVPADWNKTGVVTLRSLFFLMFYWVLILSVSFKAASYIYTR